jgi:hypothetical protein
MKYIETTQIGIEWHLMCCYFKFFEVRPLVSSKA